MFLKIRVVFISKKLKVIDHSKSLGNHWNSAGLLLLFLSWNNRVKNSSLLRESLSLDESSLYIYQFLCVSVHWEIDSLLDQIHISGRLPLTLLILLNLTSNRLQSLLLKSAKILPPLLNHSPDELFFLLIHYNLWAVQESSINATSAVLIQRYLLRWPVGIISVFNVSYSKSIGLGSRSVGGSIVTLVGLRRLLMGLSLSILVGSLSKAGRRIMEARVGTLRRRVWRSGVFNSPRSRWMRLLVFRRSRMGVGGIDRRVWDRGIWYRRIGFIKDRCRMSLRIDSSWLFRKFRKEILILRNHRRNRL